MSEQIVSVIYSLQRIEPVAYNTRTNEEVHSWVYVKDSGREISYKKNEIKTTCRQIKTTIIEEVVD